MQSFFSFVNFDNELKLTEYNVEIMNKKFSLTYNILSKIFRKFLSLKNKNIVRYFFIENIIDDDIYTLQKQRDYQKFLVMMREHDYRIKLIINKTQETRSKNKLRNKVDFTV